ncbi:MAG: hypothetical protein HPY66_3241 [Firmicutes bacterium]|nr:hypothetical protein [Bacillota bacterium]
MHLNKDDIRKFYRIWFGILEYTNQKYNVASKLKLLGATKPINPNDVVPVRNALWEHDNIIDEYINTNPNNLDEDEIRILSSWKTRISGTFLILKHLKNDSVFMHAEKGGKAYGVIGISEPIAEMFHPSHLPLLVETALIPFKDKIIYDSLLMPYNMHIGSNMRRDLNGEYKALKERYGIIRTL